MNNVITPVIVDAKILNNNENRDKLLDVWFENLIL